MALTDKQKEILNRQIGVLDGLSWTACAIDNADFLCDALDVVICELQKVLNDGKEETCCEDT